MTIDFYQLIDTCPCTIDINQINPDDLHCHFDKSVSILIGYTRISVTNDYVKVRIIARKEKLDSDNLFLDIFKCSHTVYI